MERKVLPVLKKVLLVDALECLSSSRLSERDADEFIRQCEALRQELSPYGHMAEAKRLLSRLRRIRALVVRKRKAAAVFRQSEVFTWQDFETV